MSREDFRSGGGYPPGPSEDTEHQLAELVREFVRKQVELQACTDAWLARARGSLGEIGPVIRAFERLAEFKETLEFERMVTLVAELSKPIVLGGRDHPTCLPAAEFMPTEFPVSDGREEATIVEGTIQCEADTVVSRDCLLNADVDWLKVEKNQLHVMTGVHMRLGRVVDGAFPPREIPSGFMTTKMGSVYYAGLIAADAGTLAFREAGRHKSAQFMRFGRYAKSYIARGEITPRIVGLDACLVGDGEKAKLMLKGGRT